jgi:hypothetical protein
MGTKSRKEAMADELHLFCRARENAEAIANVGRKALEGAKVAGVPVFYMEPGCPDIIREYPDGKRERIRPMPDGDDIVLGELDRRIDI